MPVYEAKTWQRPLALKKVKPWLCMKEGWGQGNGDIGTCEWGLGTWGRETRDFRTSSMGHRDVWDGGAGMSKTGTQGTWDVNDYRNSRR